MSVGLLSIRCRAALLFEIFDVDCSMYGHQHVSNTYQLTIGYPISANITDT